MAVALDFNYDDRIITVLSPDIQVTCQELVNLIAAERASSTIHSDDYLYIGGAGNETGEALGFKSIAEWEGKKSLGNPGEFTGINITLLGWKLDFQEFVASGPLETLVLGGNLLAIDINGNSVNPIVSTVNVCTIAQASSATFSEAQANKQLQYQIESLQSHVYRQTGNTFYVDPHNGSDTFDGQLPEQPTVGSKRGPKATFAAALALCQSGRHDGIYFVQSNVGAPSILDENIVINIEDLHVRGPGPGFHIRSASALVPTVQITAAHVSLTDVRVLPPVGGGLSCVDCTASEPLLKDVVIQNSTGEGVVLAAACDHFVLDNVTVDNCATKGIHIKGAPDGLVRAGRVHNCDIGLHFDALGGSVDGQCLVEGTVIYDHATKGIRIDSGFSENFIRASTVFSENGSGQAGGISPFHDIENNEASTHITLKPADVAQRVERNAFLAESHYEDHSWQGQVFYVDSGIGRNDWDGSRDAPFATIQYAVDQATDGGHDTIFLVGDVALTEFDEQITISKDFVSILGPGGGVRVKSTTDGTVFTVSGNGVSLRGFRVQGHTAGTGHGIHCTGNGLRASQLRLERAQGDGVRLEGATDCRVSDVLYNENGIGGDGVYLDGSSTTTEYNLIEKLRIFGAGNSGVVLVGANCTHNVIKDCIIQDNADVGVDVGAGVLETSVISNQLGNNINGPTRDNGTDTHIENNEQWATEDLLRVTLGLVASK